MIEYRLANSKDMSQLAKVHKECFPDSITANILIQLLKANKILWSKLWDKIRFTKIYSKKRGGDSYKKLMDHSDQRSAIWYIAVTESYRGKGVAQKLLHN